MICDSRLQRLTAEEDNAPPAVAAEQEAPLQPEDAQAEQCNGQGQANGLPNGKPAPARPLSFKRQGSSSSVSNQQPKNSRSSPVRNGRTSPPQSAKVHESMNTSNLRQGIYPNADDAFTCLFCIRRWFRQTSQDYPAKCDPFTLA